MSYFAKYRRERVIWQAQGDLTENERFWLVDKWVNPMISIIYLSIYQTEPVLLRSPGYGPVDLQKWDAMQLWNVPHEIRR